MISNQILQKTVDGLAQISKADFAVTDTDGISLASTFAEVGDFTKDAAQFADSSADSQVVDGCHFFKVYDEKQLEFVVFVKGDDETAAMLGQMAAFQIEELVVAYKERFDKENFIKNLLLDNLLLVDIYNRAKKLHVELEAKRVVMIVECGSVTDGDELDRVKNVFGGRSRDFVTAVDERNIIVVKQIDSDNAYEELEKTAKVIVDAFSDRRGEVRVSYGTVVSELKDVSRSYKEAAMALDVGKIFFKEHQVIAYSVLGIGRLIYQLPIPLCKMFIQEIFEKKSPDEFDEETLVTINKFFENSLNVSETSRQLYIHRNTLVYRLDKLQKSTGLDLRVFEDAITFKIALMVVEYMKYMEDLEY
ncbi:MAG: helix-turn-helix domain-containing protein [Lachnospiraceae bacterium]|nr:helix-turn-helix domain-containing protein [Lachnospiraceae bacterium]